MPENNQDCFKSNLKVLKKPHSLKITKKGLKRIKVTSKMIKNAWK